MTGCHLSVCKVAIPTVQSCYTLKDFNNSLVVMEMNQPLVVNHNNPFVGGKSVVYRKYLFDCL